MAIVVSEYGKVLGLVTMDDLLAQIFGVLRDERTDLQASMPNMRIGRRTPMPGVPTKETDSGPVVKQDIEQAVLDPPRVRPIHPPDEVTPPAIDLEELRRRGN
jgi:hypothetical protein